jgi:hypothetical protein
MSASAVVIAFCTLGLLAAIVYFVSGPLRAAAERRAAGEDEPDEPAPAQARAEERQRLEFARETKYREIRDAELDYRTGKLSETDYRELDAELRAEALVILDSLEGEGGGTERGPDPAPATPTAASEARSRSRRTGPRRRSSSD